MKTDTPRTDYLVYLLQELAERKLSDPSWMHTKPMSKETRRKWYEEIKAGIESLERELAEVRATRFSNDEIRQAYKSGVAAERERCIKAVEAELASSAYRCCHHCPSMLLVKPNIITRIAAGEGERNE